LSFFCSAEFGSIVEISLQAVVDKLVELMGVKFKGGSITSGLPLARVLPQVAQMCPLLLEEPSKNQFIQIIKNIQEVEVFFTLLYANMPHAQWLIFMFQMKETKMIKFIAWKASDNVQKIRRGSKRDIGAKILAFIFSMSHFPFVVFSDA